MTHKDEWQAAYVAYDKVRSEYHAVRDSDATSATIEAAYAKLRVARKQLELQSARLAPLVQAEEIEAARVTAAGADEALNVD